MTEPDPIQVLMHPALVDDFREWLDNRGLELRKIGVLSEGDLPSWIVTPTDEVLGVKP